MVTDLEADTIKEILVVSNIREVLRNRSAGGQEHSVRHFPARNEHRYGAGLPDLHDVGLVHGGNTLAASGSSIVERVTGDALRGVPCDELDGLNNTVHNLQIFGEQ